MNSQPPEEGILTDAIRAEKEYKWLEAAKAHEQKLNIKINKADAAESYKNIGFC